MLSSSCYFIVFAIFFGENAGMQTRNCCRRVSHVHNIGFDLTGHPVLLDVGRCSVRCEESPMTGPAYVSVLERLRGEKETSPLMCNSHAAGGRSTCEPSRSHVETVAFNSGPKFYDVIDECVCRKALKRCERIPKLKMFFLGTKYEATVDVGQCAGRCRSKKNGKLCQSVRTKPQPVMGPNGILSVETVVECRCEGSCYRQQFNVALTEMTENFEGVKEQTTKVVDVGRCVGSCSAIEHCVVHSTKRGEKKCLMSLETTDVTCGPVRVHDVSYVDRHGQEKRIAQIRRCGCT